MKNKFTLLKVVVFSSCCYLVSVILTFLLVYFHHADSRAEQNLNTQKVTINDEHRGIWLWGSSVSDKGAETIAEELSRHHINNVYLLVKGLSGKVAFTSKLAPSARPDKDTLAEVIEACHKRDIKVHAWFMYHGDYSWGKLHPEDAMYHVGNPEAWDKGPYSKKDSADNIPICPQSQEYQNYMKNLIAEVIDNYQVDGIHLDGIRYGHMAYCFCLKHQELAAQKGINLERVRKAIFKSLYAPDKVKDYYLNAFHTGNQDIGQWVMLRQTEITNIVKDIRTLIKSKNNNIQLSAAFMPEGGEIKDTFALCHYAQNYATAGVLLDFVIPMSYHKSYKKDKEWVVDITLNSMKKSKRPVYSGVQAFGEDVSMATLGGENKSAEADARLVTANELKQTIETIRKHNINGFVLFRYGTITPEMWNSLPE